MCVHVVSSVGGRVRWFGAVLCDCLSGLVWRSVGCGVCFGEVTGPVLIACGSI